MGARWHLRRTPHCPLVRHRPHLRCGRFLISIAGISGRAAAEGLAAERRECPRNLTPRGERAV